MREGVDLADHQPTNEFRRIPGVVSVPVFADWRTITHEAFLANSDVPMVFPGLAAATGARTWSRQFFGAFGDDIISVRGRRTPGGDAPVRSMRLADFIAALDAGEQGIYLAEWYLFKDHPELLTDLTTGMPGYLADDWLESIPPPLAFGADTRNNLYWGANGSATAVHCDSFNGCTWNVTLTGVKRWVLFSARGVAQPLAQWWKELEQRRFLDERGLFTPETVHQYLIKPPDGLPHLTFCIADVSPGDGIFVPWRWAHQVENLGESIALSRFYVSEGNYRAFLGYFRETSGPWSSRLLRILIGTRAARAVFKEPDVRRWLANSRSAAPLRALMARAMRR